MLGQALTAHWMSLEVPRVTDLKQSRAQITWPGDNADKPAEFVSSIPHAVTLRGTFEGQRPMDLMVKVRHLTRVTTNQSNAVTYSSHILTALLHCTSWIHPILNGTNKRNITRLKPSCRSTSIHSLVRNFLLLHLASILILI